MAINVKFSSASQPLIQTSTIGVSIDNGPNIGVIINNPNLHEIKFKLNIREAHNGDLMIFDHPDIDIVIMREKKKVVTFAKDLATDIVYGTSSRLMERLRTKGVIAYETIQGGNVYGSLEGQLLEMKDPEQKDMQMPLVLNQISEWIESERPYFETVEEYEQMYDDELTHPDAEHSTELGKVPQDAKKGSIQPYVFGAYPYGGYYYQE
tara:strand:- start:958 stop:1581 length:624 start_codon:yes stop_codon:yes gene_type:complete